MDSDFRDAILLIIVIGAVAGVILGALFGVMQAWRRHLRKR